MNKHDLILIILFILYAVSIAINVMTMLRSKKNGQSNMFTKSIIVIVLQFVVLAMLIVKRFFL